MIETIKITWRQFEKICDTFDHMYFTADNYCPTKEEIVIYALNDWKTNYLFLLWVEETGVETEENKEDRKFLSQMLRKYLSIGSSS